MLSIAVCIKQVPDAHRAVFDAATGVIDRSCTENIMNPDDLHALETALAIRGKYAAHITAITLGPPQASDILREAYAIGVDRCVLVTDRRFAGSDSLVTSRALARCIDRLGPFDIIVTGFEAIDGNTAHVSFQLSEFMRVPLVTQIHGLTIESDHAVIERLYGHEYQKIRVRFPILLAIGRNTNRVRIPRLADINTAADKEISVMTMDDIGGSVDDYGAAGSPTIVIETKVFTHRRERQILGNGSNEAVGTLIHKLKKYNILKY